MRRKNAGEYGGAASTRSDHEQEAVMGTRRLASHIAHTIGELGALLINERNHSAWSVYGQTSEHGRANGAKTFRFAAQPPTLSSV
jgi:hypothetical protein